MVTAAFQMLLNGNILGSIAKVYTSSPLGEWTYLIISLTILVGSYIRTERIEIVAVLGMILATPVLSLTPSISLEASRVGFVLLVISVSSILYMFGRVRI